jgi:hypothetical protein
MVASSADVARAIDKLKRLTVLGRSNDHENDVDRLPFEASGKEIIRLLGELANIRTHNDADYTTILTQDAGWNTTGNVTSASAQRHL